ncbi:hypothetical protein [Kushneria marisflavi]|uniref:Uncharacterized protein n=1 Tax=Kushneria marisflavi TaxID=157779 RepID=A0A240USF6_9GAMM|nr:hypothetical protein [Kushneria marisflavi]ART63972.1 hypothetical protein B9H00_13650 [Kushneria marisflavi]RKD85695.1 hypothetical protein C8D96_1587 [Kushneria marisflavi]
MSSRSFPPSASTKDDDAFASLGSERLRWSKRRVRLQEWLKSSFQQQVGIPFEEFWFQRWLKGQPGGAQLERVGLPRRSIEKRLGDRLVVHIHPRDMIRDVNFKGVGGKRPSSSAFLWDGEWDESRGDLRHGSRYEFITDLDEHRDDLTRTRRFQAHAARLKAGKPWASAHEGILLDSEEKILAYLNIYLTFLDDMACHGFDTSRSKDTLGVVVTREGHLLKINRGLHRLAMAQRLGLASIPVTVMAVHRQWWERVTAGTTGQVALDRLACALVDCTPEQRPGRLDPGGEQDPIQWPAPIDRK